MESETDIQGIYNVITRHKAKAFETLTIKEFRRDFGAPLEPCLRALARLEALDWTPPAANPDDPPQREAGNEDRRSGMPIMHPISEIRALADRVLRFAWLSTITPTDLRFAHAGPGSLAEWINAHLQGGQVPSHFTELLMKLDAANGLTAADEVRALAKEASIVEGKSQEADRQLAIYLTKTLAKGEGAALPTAQNVARLFSVSRNRVSQVCDNLNQTLRNRASAMPAVDRLLQALSAIAPCTTAEAEQSLSELIGVDAGVGAIFAWATNVGHKNLSVKVRQVRTIVGVDCVFTSMVEKAGSPPWIANMIRYIEKDQDLFGCTNILRIAGFLALKDGILIDQATVEEALQATPEFRWLDKESGWFSVGASDGCTAANRIRKLMAVAQEHVGADEISAILAKDDVMFARSINRTTGLGAAIPPPYILKELMKEWPWLTLIQRGRFIANDTFDSVGHLTTTEEIAVTVIERYGGVACKFEILNEAVDQLDVTTMTVHQVVSSSPVLMRIEHGLYRLNGRTITDEALARARDRYRTKLANLSESEGFDPNRFRLRITEAALRTEQYTMPIRFQYLQGRMLDIFDEHGKVIGQARVRQTRPILSGLNRFFSPKEGDEYHIEVLDNALRVRLATAQPPELAAD